VPSRTRQKWQSRQCVPLVSFIIYIRRICWPLISSPYWLILLSGTKTTDRQTHTGPPLNVDCIGPYGVVNALTIEWWYLPSWAELPRQQPPQSCYTRKCTFGVPFRQPVFRKSVQIKSGCLRVFPRGTFGNCWCEVFYQTRRYSSHPANSVKALKVNQSINHIHFIVSEKVCNITIQTEEVQIHSTGTSKSSHSLSKACP